jgi:hypothetical protein
MRNTMWTYREDIWTTTDLNGFNVEALDGEIGSVDEKTNDVGSSYIVVDTGPWIFGKKVLLPAGVIDRIDLDNHRVFVNRTKDEIKSAPEWDETRYTDATYRDQVGTYYESRTPTGAGTRTQM